MIEKVMDAVVTNEQEGTEWTNYVIQLVGTRSRE